MKTKRKICTLFLVFALIFTAIPADFAIADTAPEGAIQIILEPQGVAESCPCKKITPTAPIIIKGGAKTSWSELVDISVNDIYIKTVYKGQNWGIFPKIPNTSGWGGEWTGLYLGSGYASWDPAWGEDSQTNYFTVSNQYSINSLDYGYIPHENFSDSSKYIKVSKQELIDSGFGEMIEDSDSYYFIAVKCAPNPAYGLIVQEKTFNADKSRLTEAISKASGEEANLYYHDEDRWNGRVYSQTGFWNEVADALSAANEVNAAQGALQEQVDSATDRLNEAFEKLIPKTQANTTLLYEKLKQSDISDENSGKYTEDTWNKFKQAKNNAKTKLDEFFDTEGKPSEYNTASKQNEIDESAEALSEAFEDLTLNSFTDMQGVPSDAFIIRIGLEGIEEDDSCRKETLSKPLELKAGGTGCPEEKLEIKEIYVKRIFAGGSWGFCSKKNLEPGNIYKKSDDDSKSFFFAASNTETYNGNIKKDSFIYGYTLLNDICNLSTSKDDLDNMGLSDILEKDSKQDYFLAVKTKGHKPYGIVIQAFTEKIDKSELEKEIADAKALNENDYYCENDRWNGVRYSSDGFWNELQKKIAEAEKIYMSEEATEYQVETVISELRIAVDRLIKRSEANTTELYEILNNTRRERDEEFRKVNPFTPETFSEFKESYIEAEEALKAYFADGKRPEAAKQGEVDSLVSEVLRTYNLLQYTDSGFSDVKEWAIVYFEVKAHLDSLELASGDYTAESWDEWQKSKLALDEYWKKVEQKNYCEIKKLAAEVSGAYSSYRALKTSKDSIRVNVRVLDNVGASEPEFGLKNEKLATIDRSVVLNKESSSLYDLIEEISYDSEPKNIAIDKGKYFSTAVYINDIFALLPNKGSLWGMMWDTIDIQYINFNKSLCRGINLNDGDKVEIVKVISPLQNYYIHNSSTDYRTYRNYVGLLKIRCSENADRIFEAKAGDKLNIGVDMINATPNGMKKNLLPSPDVSVFLSEPSDSKETAASLPATDKLEGKTDENGNIEIEVIKEGWYKLFVANTTPQTMAVLTQEMTMPVGGKFNHILCGDYVFLYVSEANEQTLENKKTEYMAELEKEFNKFDEEYYTEESFETLEKEYSDGRRLISDSKTIEEAASAKKDYLNKIAVIQRENNENNIVKVKNARWSINKLPESTKFSKAYIKTFEKFKEDWGNLTEYQKKQLTSSEYDKAVNLIDKFGKDYNGVPEAFRGKLKVVVAGGDVDIAQIRGIFVKKDFEYYREHWFADPLNRPGALNYRSYYDEDETTFSPGELPEGKTYEYRIIELDKDNFSIVEGGGLNFYLGLWGQGEKSFEKIEVIEESGGKEIRDYEIKKGEDTLSGYNPYPSDPGLKQNAFKSFAEFRIENMPASDITVKLYFSSALSSEKEEAAAQLETAKNAYSKAEYSNDNWLMLMDAYNEGIKDINNAKDSSEIDAAKTKAVDGMSSIKKGHDNTTQPDPDKPTIGSLGSVHVIVENTTYKDAPSGLYGRMIDTVMPLEPESTIMSCVLEALEREGYGFNGTGGGTSTTDKHKITYISNISKGNLNLGEFDGGPQSGWMGTLNDWFTNEGFASFGANKTGDYRIVDGDEIKIMYTKEGLGKDLGGTWGNSDTSLKSLEVNGGALSPNFSKDMNEYVIVTSGGKISFVPTASNKNYQVKTFLNEKNISRNVEYYKRGENIPAKSGDTIYIGVGEYSWLSMNNQGAESRPYTGTWYKIIVLDNGDSESVDKIISKIPDITIDRYKSSENYVRMARNAYNALSTAAKTKVKNVDKLIKAEKDIESFKKIDNVKTLLKEIPKKSELKTSDAALVKKAYSEYIALTKEEKGYITVSDAERYNEAVEWMKERGFGTLDAIVGVPDKPDVETVKDGGSNTTTTKTEVKTGSETGAGGSSISTATVSVKDANAAEMVKQAKENKSSEIVLDAKVDEADADKIKVELPKKVVDNVIGDTKADLTVKLPGAEVKIDQKALKEIASQSKGDKITVEVEKVKNPTEEQKKLAGDNAEIFVLTVKSGDTVIHSFGTGQVTVRKLIPEKLNGKKVAAVYLNDKGEMEVMQGKKVVIDGKNYYEFTTSHFSEFALVDADEAGIEVTDSMTADDVKEVVKDMKLKVTTKALKKSIRVTVRADKETLTNLKDSGYTVKYKFYRSDKKSRGYKAMLTKSGNKYTNTKVKKGKAYYYKARLMVYDESGKLIARTSLKQANASKRLIKVA